MPEKILILTDSSTTMSLEKAKEYDVKIVPLSMLRNDNIEYVDELLNIDTNQIGKMLDDGFTFKTSCTPIGYLQDVIDKALETYDKIVAIPISSGWSSQYSHLKALEKEYPNRLVTCDTREYGYALEILAEKLREKINNGIYDLEVLQSYAENFHKYTSCFLSMRKLQGAVASGRVPKIVSKLLTWVKAYPIIKFDYINHVETILRKWDGVIVKCIELFKGEYNHLEPDEIEAFTILTANNDPEEIEYAKDQVVEILGIKREMIAVRPAPIILHTVVWNQAIGFQLIAKVEKKETYVINN